MSFSSKQCAYCSTRASEPVRNLLHRGRHACCALTSSGQGREFILVSLGSHVICWMLQSGLTSNGKDDAGLDPPTSQSSTLIGAETGIERIAVARGQCLSRVNLDRIEAIRIMSGLRPIATVEADIPVRQLRATSETSCITATNSVTSAAGEAIQEKLRRCHPKPRQRSSYLKKEPPGPRTHHNQAESPQWLPSDGNVSMRRDVGGTRWFRQSGFAQAFFEHRAVLGPPERYGNEI